MSLNINLKPKGCVCLHIFSFVKPNGSVVICFVIKDPNGFSKARNINELKAMCTNENPHIQANMSVCAIFLSN